ncbi:MAG TPA: TonB-dependent receptor, partial [Chitinophagales bacterium]|nr:TonB-dependent receptor [Chitinophagales bacterium]
EESFLKEIYIQRARANANLRYRFKKLEGLTIGVNSTYYVGRSATFFLWQDDSLGAFIPQGVTDSSGPDVVNHLSSTRVAVDPYLNFLSKNNTRHSLKGHFYLNDQPANQENQSTRSTVTYGEYQFTKPFKFGLHITAGLVANAIEVQSDLYGNHDGDNQAVYLQLGYKIGRLGLTAGARKELFRIDSVSDISPVVFRAGLNYKLFEYTHLRASFGQGYRFPTVAEKYVKTNAGSLYAYPNPGLEPETSWSAEAGVQQGFRVGGIEGYADAAAFTQRLDNFMEFTLGQWGNPQSDPFNGIGFRSENVDEAIISGFETNVFASGDIGQSTFTVLTGFTFINPIDVNGRAYSDSVFSSYFDSIKVKDTNGDALFSDEERDASLQKHHKDFSNLESVYDRRYLKYRYTTTYKIEVDWSYKRLSLGAGCRYNSFMIRVDPFLGFISGVSSFREDHPNGDLVFDARIGVRLNEIFKLSFIGKNITNEEYWDRPARLNAPRNYTLQLAAKF